VQAKQSLRTPILTRGLRQQAPEETGEQPPSSSNWRGNNENKISVIICITGEFLSATTGKDTRLQWPIASRSEVSVAGDAGALEFGHLSSFGIQRRRRDIKIA
jgi:hypothetical protein